MAVALIIAILAFLMASANLIIYLAKAVFSTHQIQMVPVETLAQKNGKPIVDEFEDFDMSGPMDAVLDDKKK
jgi:hypothetical protein